MHHLLYVQCLPPEPKAAALLVWVSEKTLLPDNAARLSIIPLDDWLGHLTHAGAVTAGFEAGG
ncbi:MAG: hypothetical protein ACYC6Y_09115 [Thermoguttaceae bacterium]